jgi:integrase
VQRLPEIGLMFGPPKSNKSRRTIPLPAASAKVLRTHRANQAAEALALGPAWVDSGLVFTSTVGTVIEPRNLNRFFDELIGKARVRRIRFHDLRHTCASLLLAQNVPARVVMEILGHSQLAMTTDLYSHVMPTALREAQTPWIVSSSSRTEPRCCQRCCQLAFCAAWETASSRRNAP